MALARQLMQKQRQAEVRATSLLGKHRSPRPAAHITPRTKGKIRFLNQWVISSIVLEARVGVNSHM